MLTLLLSTRPSRVDQPKCNGGATVALAENRRRLAAFALVFCGIVGSGQPTQAQEAQPDGGQSTERGVETGLQFLAGAATALAAHEAGHLAFDVAFDADPGVRRVEFGGIPFFAITHRDVSRRREFTIASSGFWIQYAIDEWLLTSRPRLREERAPFAKGIVAFNLLGSAAYAVAAFAQAGPDERDTRAMAATLGPGGANERWVGLMVLAPAALDAYRYYTPGSRWAAWASRAVKVGMVLLVLR
jgi:hypothetical protein